MYQEECTSQKLMIKRESSMDIFYNPVSKSLRSSLGICDLNNLHKHNKNHIKEKSFVDENENLFMPILKPTAKKGNLNIESVYKDIKCKSCLSTTCGNSNCQMSSQNVTSFQHCCGCLSVCFKETAKLNLHKLIPCENEHHLFDDTNQTPMLTQRAVTKCRCN